MRIVASVFFDAFSQNLAKPLPDDAAVQRMEKEGKERFKAARIFGIQRRLVALRAMQLPL